MTYSVYIDHPDHLGAYEYLPGDQSSEDVVSRKVGAKATFVYNSYAGISKGDIFRVTFDNPEDATAFALKCEYSLLDKNKIEEYKRKDKRDQRSLWHDNKDY